jgi:hypothetical protein
MFQISQSDIKFQPIRLNYVVCLFYPDVELLNNSD